MAASLFADLSPLTLGTVQLGTPYGVVNATGLPGEDEAMAVLSAAFDGGVRCLDTARAYGVAEQRVGQWLARTGQRPAIVTKTPKMPDGIDAPAWLRTQFQLSLTALGLDRVDGLLLHNSGDLHRPGVHAALCELAASGRVGGFGVSAYDPEQVYAALERPGLAAVQVPASMLDRRMERAGVFDACRAAGVAVFVRSVYLQGLLAAEPAALPAGAAGLAPCLRRLDALAAATGVSRQSLCLAAALHRPGVASVVVGAETAGQIRDSLSAAAAARDLPAAVLEQALAAVADAPAWIGDPRQWAANGL